PRRRSCRTVSKKLAEGLAILMAPVISFTADEAWANIPCTEGSVFEQRFPEVEGAEPSATWDRFWEIREAVQAAMEPHRAAKTIGTSLDAVVTLTLGEADRAVLAALGEAVDELLVVSNLIVLDGVDLDVQVQAHEGTKCPRCWNHRGGSGQGEDADLCPRCWSVFSDGRSA
ncbi:MAG: class I tRNA ligase family protein, partial [Holophaga sp.]|nr:class I tRNA ligase family protein [Holophaga sp.]